MTGTVTAVIRRREGVNGGYGFIRDDEGSERFFHARNLRGITFDKVNEGDKVEFRPVAEVGKGNGLRADDVSVLA